MVLVLKHWKSRSSPGIIADGRGINPFTISKSRCRVSRAAAFSSLAHAGGRTHGAAGWSSPVARQAHNLKVVGSNPTPATTSIQLARCLSEVAGLLYPGWTRSANDRSIALRKMSGVGKERGFYRAHMKRGHARPGGVRPRDVIGTL